MERIAFVSGQMYAAKLCIEYKVNFLPSSKVECNQSVDFHANVFAMQLNNFSLCIEST